MFLIYSFFWFDRICFVSRLWFWCWSGLIQDLSTDHSSLCVYECKQQLICFWLQSGFNSPSDDEEDEDVSAPAVTSPLSLSLSLSLSLLSLPFISIFACCVRVVRCGEPSCQLDAARQKSLQTSSHHMSLALPRFLASLLSLSLFIPWSCSQYWFISPFII